MGLLNKLMGNAGAAKPEDLETKYGDLLIEDEHFDIGFQLLRDVFIFTNKRLILVDIQGITGRKVEYLSLPYKSISRFSIESAGTFDLDAELKIWISSAADPAVSKQFNKSVNIYEVQQMLASYVL